jgi:hypothetical protein
MNAFKIWIWAYFEGIDAFEGVHFAPSGSETVCCEFFYLREDVPFHIYI